MALVNLYCSSDFSLSSRGIDGIKEHVAEKLSSESRKLEPAEISVRLIKVESSSAMIGDLEVTITAHGYSERIKNSDQIATEIASYLQKSLPGFKKVLVWLALPELGHTDTVY